MKKSLNTLAAPAVILLGLAASGQALSLEEGFYDDLRNSRWCDGFVIYHPEHPEKHTADAKAISFQGGSMHEGGYQATLTNLKKDQGRIVGGTVKVEYSDDRKAELVIVSGKGEKHSMLHIRDMKGKLVRMYNPVPPAANWWLGAADSSNVCLALQGHYKDSQGVSYEFALDPSATGQDEGRCLLRIAGKEERLEFAEEYDFTIPVFRMDGIYVEGRPVAGGLELRYIGDNLDEIRNPEGVPREGVYRMLTPLRDRPRFAFTGEQILNMGFLEHYDPQTLRIMRNEIMARHGYRFSSRDLADYFGGTEWYMPSSQEVSLSPVEQINVTMIKLVEEQKKQGD